MFVCCRSGATTTLRFPCATVDSRRLATLCYHLSHSSRLRNSDGDVMGRGGVLRGCTHRRKCDGFGFCISSNVSNAAFGHPNFRRVVTSVRTNLIGHIVVGSVSHFKHSCLRINVCARVVFPRRSVRFVTIGSNMSDARNSGRFAPFHGVVGR